MLQLTIADDLTLKIGRATVRVSPTEGLHLAETLARKAFRRALEEEALRMPAPAKDAEATHA